jgi:hypothetical protein
LSTRGAYLPPGYPLVAWHEDENYFRSLVSKYLLVTQNSFRVHFGSWISVLFFWGRGRNIAKLRHWSKFLAKSPCFLKNESPNFAQFCFVCFFLLVESIAIGLSIGYTFKWSSTKPSPLKVEILPWQARHCRYTTKLGVKKKHRDSWWGPKLHHLGTCDNKCRAMPKGVTGIRACPSLSLVHVLFGYCPSTLAKAQHQTWPNFHNIRPDPNNLIFIWFLHFEKCLLSVDGNNISCLKYPLLVPYLNLQ